MKNNETIYDMYADKTENKFTEKKRKLKTRNTNTKRAK